ncbi:MAG: BatD family protein [Bacteroidota bacterium]
MKRQYLNIIFLLITSGIFAQVTFKSTVSKNQLGLNERLRIEFSIDKQGGDDFSPPSFNNFKVLAGPSQATSFSYINGKKSFKLTYTYIIQPTQKGVFKIGSASITYKGEVIKTNTVKVKVTDAVEIPKDPNDPRYLASQNVHLIAEVSNGNPYVGESISIIYKMYVNNINVNNFRETSSPSFSGFWNQNIEVKSWDVKDGTYQGEPYRYVVVKRAVLVPNKSGKITIEPLESEITAGVPMGRRDFFGNMMLQDINFTATTGKKIINVKPLPETNKPLNFKGAVGDFQFDVKTSKNILKANESANIKVKITGKGNLKLIELPEILAPQGLEVYDPEHKENIKTRLSGMQGEIYDEYAIVPQFKGKFKIPEVSFSYFNPKEEQYHTIVSEPIFINVPEGTAPVAGTGSDKGTFTKQHVVGKESDIRFIKIQADFIEKEDSEDFYGSTLFYLLLLLPLLSIPFGIFIGKKKQERDSDILGNKRRKADKLARKYLSEAKKQLGKKEAFYESLERALHNYLKAKLQVETSDISMDRISKLLQDKNVNEQVNREFIEILDNCNFARYAPSTNLTMKQDFEKAKDSITKLDKQL